MTQPLASGVVRAFRLTNESGGLGLNCTPAGLSLAGVSLLRKTPMGFVPRPASEISSLLKAAYGEHAISLQARLGAIAQALNSGDFAGAMIVAIHTGTPKVSPEAAFRLAKADEELAKYNYNPDEMRDWHGRWTRDESDGPRIGTAFDAPRRQPARAQVLAAGDDIMRNIVKNACIAECSESSLPSGNGGWRFFNCLNACMSRHGYNPFVIRP